MMTKYITKALCTIIICGPLASMAQITNNYVKEIEEWDMQRVEDLKKENGFLNLAGLYWLKEGKNTFGSDSSNDIIFPKDKIPGKSGYFIYSGNTVELVPQKNISILMNGKRIKKEIIFHADSLKNPVLSYRSLRWNIIRRGEMIGIRLRDLEHSAIKNFKPIPRYPINEGWKIKARVISTEFGKNINITDVMGQTTAQKSPGRLQFEIQGKTYSLDLLHGDNNDYFIIFADNTNGIETYPSGRYIYPPLAGPDGTTYIDFNKAKNPPCAFTPFATCPLPPKQNILPIEIPAGEKYAADNKTY